MTNNAHNAHNAAGKGQPTTPHVGRATILGHAAPPANTAAVTAVAPAPHGQAPYQPAPYAHAPYQPAPHAPTPHQRVQHAPPPQMWMRFPSKLELSGVAIAGLGFAVSLSSYSASWMDGKLTHFSYVDYAALIAAAVAFGTAVVALMRLSRTEPAKKALRIGLAVLLCGLGGVHVARGAGAFAEPTEPSEPTDKFASASTAQADAPGSMSTTTVQSESGTSSISFRRRPAGITRKAGESDRDWLVRLDKQCASGGSCRELIAFATPRCPTLPHACNVLGFRVHYLGGGGKIDLAASKVALEKGCDEGHKQACGKLEALFDPKKAVEYAGPKLVEVLTNACDRGNGLGCLNLAALHLAGKAVERSRAKAEQLVRRGCDLDFEPACRELDLAGIKR